ncbi:MAG: EAL domain-containing protein [Ruminococcus sp.]|nr:EAL domain-containing protein [Ruminococcus sp.]
MGRSDNKYLWLHELFEEISKVSSDEELSAVMLRYQEENNDKDMSAVLQDISSMTKELLFLRKIKLLSGNDHKLSALSSDERRELEEAEKIIDENRFEYYFQPIVNASDGEIYSYEALMRPKSSMKLGPGHILKYAGMTDRLSDIERFTFLNVLRIIDENKEKFGGKMVFINSIPEAKLNVDDLRAISRLLLKHSDTAVIEMTEQSEADDDSLENMKERCRNMGVRIAVDDYGSGYSNVSNLLKYMPNYVKIDRSLLSNIQNSPKKRHFVREIIQFCHDNDILALAEGIETAEELHAVILLGADLIQGFYTAKPSPDIVETIPYDIKHMISRYHQEREDGRGQQMYFADSHEHIYLERMVKSNIKKVMVGTKGNGAVTLSGDASTDTQVNIVIEKNYCGSVTLINAWLANTGNRPCIDIGENCDVKLILNGDNTFDMGGIRVPQSSRLTIQGEGRLTINLDSTEYYGIGNGIGIFHGDLIFEQSGRITINANGQTGVAIGSGSGGNIFIKQGQYRIKLRSDVGLGIGSMYTNCKMFIHDCDIGIEATLARGAAIGSIGGTSDIDIYKTSAKIFLTGLELVGIGAVGGESSRLCLHDASTIININGERCSAIAALEGSTEFDIERAALRVDSSGVQALGIGGFTGDIRISQSTADTHIRVETPMDMSKYLKTDETPEISGRFLFTVNGEDIYSIHNS